MPGKKTKEPARDRDHNGRFRDLLKRELVKWYCRALYDGKVKPASKLGRQQ